MKIIDISTRRPVTIAMFTLAVVLFGVVSLFRLNINLPAEIEGQLRDNDIRNALKEAYYLIITKNIQRETRLRLGQWTAEVISPLEALKAYLESSKVPTERVKLLLEYGEKLLQEQRNS